MDRVSIQNVRYGKGVLNKDQNKTNAGRQTVCQAGRQAGSESDRQSGKADRHGGQARQAVRQVGKADKTCR
jgi:hypothetical protein